MKSLRDWWRRTALGQFLHNLPPIDRATFLVAIALVFALAFTINALANASGRPAGKLRWIDPASVRTADARP